jgi:hypothetical protein
MTSPFILLGSHVEFGLKVSYFVLSRVQSACDLSTGVRSDVKYNTVYVKFKNIKAFAHVRQYYGEVKRTVRRNVGYGLRKLLRNKLSIVKDKAQCIKLSRMTLAAAGNKATFLPDHTALPPRRQSLR